MPDEHSTIEQLLDEAMPILQTARDFPERDMTYEERGHTGSVLNYILRWDNPEWRARRGLLFQVLPDDPPLIQAVKMTVVAIDRRIGAPRVGTPDGLQNLASQALIAISMWKISLLEPDPPEPQAGIFHDPIEPLIAWEIGPEREPEPEPPPEPTPPEEVPTFEPYVATRHFRIGGTLHLDVNERHVLYIDHTRGIFRFGSPGNSPTYDATRLPGAIRAGWLVPLGQEPSTNIRAQPPGLSDEAYERVLTLLSMPEMSREGTRRELLRIMATPVGEEPQRRVPYILSYESTDRLVALILSGVRPLPGEDMMDFIDRPIPGTYPRQEPSEQETMRLMFETPIPVPPSLQGFRRDLVDTLGREPNVWMSPLAQVDHPYEKPRTSWQHILNDEGIGDDP